MKTRHTLYVYAEGNDLHGVAPEIEARVEWFIRDRSWRYGTPWVVNQQRPDDPTLKLGDLPDWEVGLNLDLPDPPNEPEGWFDDVEQVALFFAQLRSVTGRDFVIGIGDNERGYSEDLFSIDNASPDLGQLRRVIGVGGGAS
jgi:hypothetical protein